MKYYRLFGMTMASEYPFMNRFAEGSGVPDVRFIVLRTSPLQSEWKNEEPVYVSRRSTEDGEPLLSIYRLGSCTVVHYARIIDFYLQPGKITAHLLDPSYEFLVEQRLLGDVFSLWLEIQGIPAIHASAVVAEPGAIGFLSTRGGGKSTLALALMQGGCSLLTDDILAVEEHNACFYGRPGYPVMRMWPDQAEYFTSGNQDLGLVHPRYSKRRVLVGSEGFGTFCGEKQELKAFFIPERQDSDARITVETVSQKQAFIELVRHSFSARIVEALGLQAQRMDLFSRLVRQVPMYRLIFPEGFQHISRVGEIIADTIKDL